MLPSDVLFAAAGVGALGAALLTLRARSRPSFIRAGLWAAFGLGLLVQGFAPHLRIERNAFVIPGALVSRPGFDGRALVERERRMQLLSALLTVGAAAGLALAYRRELEQTLRPAPAEPAGP